MNTAASLPSPKAETESGLVQVMETAHSAFRLSHFQECIATLDSKQFKKSSSQQQVSHNKAVASFNLNKDTEALLQTLLQVIGENNMRDLITYQHRETESVSSVNTFSNYCCLFNIASLYFQQKKELRRTTQILIFLQSKLHDMNNELFAIKVCFLLLEVLLLLQTEASRSKNPDLQMVEMEKDKQIRQIPIDQFMTAIVKDLTALTTNVSVSSSAVSAGADTSVNTLNILMKQIATFLLHLYKCRIYILMDSPKQAKKEIKNALEIFQREIRKYSEESVAHAYTCLHNLQPSSPFPPLASTESKTETEHPEKISIMDRLNQMALYLKAYLEYQREHYVKAMKLLTSSQHAPPSHQTPATTPILQNNTFAYQNNMGCLYLKLERYGAAASFFQKAIAQLELLDTSSIDTVDRQEMGISLLHPNHVAIYYNCGLALLHSNQPVDAMVCFENVLAITQERGQEEQERKGEGEYEAQYHCPNSLSMTYIRLGECCIQHYKNQIAAENISTDRKAPILGYISDGPFRRVILSSDDVTLPQSSSASLSASPSICCFSKAVQYLTQALALLSRENRFLASSSSSTSSMSSVSATDGGGGEEKRDTIEPSSCLTIPELQEYASLALAYVYLKQSNWVCVQSILKQLLKAKMSGDHARYLAQNYLAEALCSLGRYDEAYEVLDIQLTLPSPETCNPITNNSSSSGWGREIYNDATHNIRPELMAEVLRNTNRAVVWALLGKLEDAQIILQSILSECPSFPPAIRCLVYTLLRLGKKQEASLLLKQLNVSPEVISKSP